MAKRTASM